VSSGISLSPSLRFLRDTFLPFEDRSLCKRAEVFPSHCFGLPLLPFFLFQQLPSYPMDTGMVLKQSTYPPQSRCAPRSIDFFPPRPIPFIAPKIMATVEMQVRRVFFFLEGTCFLSAMIANDNHLPPFEQQPDSWRLQALLTDIEVLYNSCFFRDRTRAVALSLCYCWCLVKIPL